jgi:diacylglycerol O-acyltransferase
MKPLSSEDAFFLYAETEEQHQHTLGLLVLDPSSSGNRFSIEKMSRKLERDLHVLPEFRQKLIKLPMALSPPALVDDPNFDFADHVHFKTLKSPGDLHQLSKIISRFSSKPLDKSRPLWETLFIDGLEDGRVAVCTKSHHLIADGVQGAEFMAEQFDFEANPPKKKKQNVSSWTPKQVSTLDVLGASWAKHREGQPGFRTMFNKTLKSLSKRRKMFASKEVDEKLVTAILPSAPKLKFNGGITPNRTIALGSVGMATLKSIKNHFSVTLNDVILAACTLSLRDYLLETDDLPEEPVVCAVPVSLKLRGQEAKGDAGNQVGNMIIKLPVQIADPVECLLAVHAHTVEAKKLFDESFENLMMGYIGMLPPAMANGAMKTLFNRRLMDMMPAQTNFIVSNIPGPPIPLYMLGAELKATYPIGPVLSGQGLNMTFMSMMEDMNFSVQTCREKLPEAWDLAEGIMEWVAKLEKEAPNDTRSKPARNRKKAAKAKPPAKRKTSQKAKAPAKRKPAAKSKSRTRRAPQRK